MLALLLLACGGPVVLDVAGGDEVPDESPADVVDDEQDTGIAPVVCVNELMADNRGAWTTDDDETPDWIELYNPEERDVDLSGWFISDDPADPEKVALDVEIEEEDFLVLVQGEHFDFGISDEGGTIMLSDPWGGGSRIDYGAVGPNFAVSRTTDCCTGDGCLDFVFGGTPGESNED